MPAPTRVVPIAAGSVNSNFFLESGSRRWFLRIYEEQEADGVAYEWALLRHLAAGGVPVPSRVGSPAPGEARVGGKPVAVFEVVGGRESCQAAVTPTRAAHLGAFLATCHLVADDFAQRRAGRFTRGDVRRRLGGIEALGRPELATPVAAIRSALDEVEEAWPPDLPSGVIHGDLFRDNVRWEGDRIVAAIDWESASDGARVLDLAVCLLAWCYGDRTDWGLGRALVRGYDGVRPLAEVEQIGLRLAAMEAACRFSTTRITDYHLRQGVGQRVVKDYRRFLARLEEVRSLDAEAFGQKLLG